MEQTQREDLFYKLKTRNMFLTVMFLSDISRDSVLATVVQMFVSMKHNEVSEILKEAIQILLEEIIKQKNYLSEIASSDDNNPKEFLEVVNNLSELQKVFAVSGVVQEKLKENDEIPIKSSIYISKQMW